MMSSTDHTQITVRYPFTGELIEVDEGIVDILELLWSRGVETAFSCEGNPNGFGGENFAYIAYRPHGDREITRVIHSLALPYVCWSRRDPYADVRPGGALWAVYWSWSWSVVVQVESVLRIR